MRWLALQFIVVERSVLDSTGFFPNEAWLEHGIIVRRQEHPSHRLPVQECAVDARGFVAAPLPC